MTETESPAKPDAPNDGWSHTTATNPRFDPNLGYRPVVSVCILSHRPAFKAEAEASVRAQSLWKYDMVEIVSKESPVYWGHKITDLLKAASGQYLVPLCDDDLLAPDALERWVAKATETAADFVYSDIELFGGPAGTRTVVLPDWHPVAPTQQCVPWVTALYRRDLFETPLLGTVGYDPALEYWDWDWAQRLAKGGKVGARVAAPLFRAREHQGNGHRTMNHGHAFIEMWVKHDRLDGPKPISPEFAYPPWYEGRPSVLSADDLKNAPTLPPVTVLEAIA